MSASEAGDLKRAVEDVILRPDQNTLNELDKRDTIAALDLCQVFADVSILEATPEPSPPLPTCAPSAASMNACSCSSETVPVDMPRPPPPLCTSTSLDTIVNRPQPLLYRHSSGVSRRQSRVLMTLQSRRKRSNSLTNYQKASSLGSSDSHSSVSRSEDYSQDYVAEEDETIIYHLGGSAFCNFGQGHYVDKATPASLLM
uniref:SH3 domain-containing protein n=1 Tax=Angiostrongylus cantonensis TaxID=6313 RepID=A0A158P9T5_ANGCA